MIKLLNYNLNPKKKILYNLCIIFGINKTSSLQICYNVQINPILKWNEIDDQKRQMLLNILEKNMKNYKNIKKIQRKNILKIIKNGSVKGFRHKNNLPVRGQRTHSNAKTVKRFKNNKKKSQKKL